MNPTNETLTRIKIDWNTECRHNMVTISDMPSRMIPNHSFPIVRESPRKMPTARAIASPTNGYSRSVSFVFNCIDYV